MITSEELFVRRFDELKESIQAVDDYNLLKIAAILRQLLLDEQPLVHKAIRETEIRPIFKVNLASRMDDIPIKPAIHVMGAGLDPLSMPSKKGAENLTLEQFVSRVVIIRGDAEITVRHLIKFAANKAGGVHFDLHREDEYLEVDIVLKELAKLGVHGLTVTLQAIGRVTLASLSPLRKALVKLPDEIILIAHYKIPDPKDSISFDGKNQFLETTFNETTTKDFSWNAILKIQEQTDFGERVIYEIGFDDKKEFHGLKVVYSKKGTLSAIATNGDDITLECGFEDFNKSIFYKQFFYLNIELLSPREDSDGILWKSVV